MKKFTYILGIAMSAALLFSGCMKEDIDELRRKQAENADRIAALEEWQATVNSNIGTLQQLVAALENMDYVTGVTQFTTPSPGGCKITFTKSGEVTIWNGNEDPSPVIGVDQDTDGKYYWTLNGEWLLSGGNKVPTTGENGSNGATPKVAIGSDGYWYISADGTAAGTPPGAGWTSTGKKAEGEPGPAGPQGPQGPLGDAIFAADGVDNSHPDYVVFKLADGTTKITLPKLIESMVAFDNYDLFYGSSSNNEITIMLPSTFRESDYTTLLASITDSNGTAIDVQTRADSGDAWRVAVTKPTFTGGVLDAGSAKVTLTAPANIKLSETAILTVTLTDANGKNHSVSRPVKYFDGDIVESTAGNLSSAVSGTSVTKLAIQGSMNAADFAFLKDYSGLEVLDLSMTDLTEIPNYAFNYYGTGDGTTINTTLERVAFPSTLITIGERAFCDCHALNYVNTENVREIKARAFQSCTSLTSIKFGNTLETIGNSMFYNCALLQSIEIPSSVQTLGRWVFEACPRLETVILNEGLQNLSQSTFWGSGIVSISIPSTVTQIPEWAFQECANLERITLHDGITFIGEGAFLRCRSLKQIKIPTGMTEISKYTFEDCTDLKYVDFHNGIDAIHNSAFSYCSNLDENLYLPANLTTLGSFAFGNCKSLTYVYIPGTLETITSQAFNGCVNLVTAELHDGLKRIEEWAFSGTAMTAIALPSSVTSLASMVFHDCKKLVVVISHAAIAPTIENNTFDSEYKDQREIYHWPENDYSSWYPYFKGPIHLQP